MQKIQNTGNEKYIAELASRSAYNYHVNRNGRLPVIVIEDLDLGYMSVNANLDAVAQNVISLLGFELSDYGKKYFVLYKDAFGVYDGVIPVGNAGVSILNLANYRAFLSNLNENAHITLDGPKSVPKVNSAPDSADEAVKDFASAIAAADSADDFASAIAEDLFIIRYVSSESNVSPQMIKSEEDAVSVISDSRLKINFKQASEGRAEA